MKRWRYATAAASGAALLLAVWVTSTDPLSLLSGGPAANGNAHVPGVRPPKVQHGHPSPAHHRAHQLPEFMKILEDVALGLFAAACVAFLVTAVISASRRTRERRAQSADTTIFDAFDVPPAMVVAAERQLLALREGEPRNAIVACWMALEAACGDSSFPRAPAETSTEFTSRVLAHFDVREDVISALSALYREARFSEHRLTEQHRERAISGLNLLLADLRTRRAAEANLVTAS